MKNAEMWQDIQSQAETMEAALPNLRSAASDLPGRTPTRIVLTGSGDSFIAAHAVQQQLASVIDAPVLAVPSLDAARYLDWRNGDVMVPISISGEVARTLEAAGAARAAGAFTVAVTARADSSLAHACEHMILMPPPLNRAVPHCRDFVLTVAALLVLLEAWSGRRFAELDAWPQAIASHVTRSEEWAAALGLSTGRTWFLGGGPDRGTAMYGAMKYWEAAGLEAWWDDLEEFAHGSFLMAAPGDRAVLIADGGGANRAMEMAAGLRRMEIEPIVISPAAPAGHFRTEPLGDPKWHPLVSCVPIQLLTLHEARSRDLDVEIPLDGKPHSALWDEMHREWTRGKKPAAGLGQ